ncbi:MAG: hypothetical protein H7A23_25425 [Leptospiraceae bacterium]|nr:hypothetical protein [Leptospiraceae bacterium]MCP5497908.1 hypothetical protein [Leptospiraceae bacterium]
MKKILLLIKSKENLSLLRLYLEKDYTTIIPDSNRNLDDFDMCITDGLSYQDFKPIIESKRNQSHPIFLPLILVTTRNYVSKVTQFLGEGIDEYVISPVEKLELSVRIKNLFKMQDMTIQLKKSNVTLESENYKKTELLSAILENAQNSIAAFVSIRDPSNQIVDFECILSNPFNNFLFNFKKEEPGNNKLLTKQHSIELFDKCVKVVETGESEEYEQCFIVDNNDVWVHGTIAKLGDGFVSTYLDITKQKFNEIELRHINGILERRMEERTWELQEKKALLSAVLDSSLDGIAFYKNIRNEDGIVVDFEFILANERTHKFFNKLDKDLNGKRFLQEFPNLQNSTLFAKSLEVTNSGVTEDFEESYKLENSDLYFYYTIVKLGDGLVTTISDITKRKQAEITLQKINDELELRVQDRTKELQEKEEKLKEALHKEKELNEIKSRFISTVSHEFRTPLATIRSSSQMLKRYKNRLSLEEETKILSEIDEMCVRLTELLEEILYIRKAEANKIDFNPESVDLRELAEKIIYQLLLLVERKDRIILEIYGEESNRTFDKKLLRHILTNLLTNALKFSHPDTSVNLQIIYESDYTIIKVIDHGHGIPADAKKNIFQPFFRAENVKNIQGTGLGLSIVKSCIERHNGEISFESFEKQGTTFITKFPILIKSD